MAGLFGCLCQFVALYGFRTALLARLVAFLSRKHASQGSAVLRLDSARSFQVLQGSILTRLTV
jgi:hypothetical protein